jgi:hypothetical protein
LVGFSKGFGLSKGLWISLVFLQDQLDFGSVWFFLSDTGSPFCLNKDAPGISGLKTPFDKETGFFDKWKVSPKSRKEKAKAQFLWVPLFICSGISLQENLLKRKKRKARKETQSQAPAFLFSTLPPSRSTSALTLALALISASQGHPKRHPQ